ncbi:MAG: flavin reductase [Sphingobacteriales bacterium JAD_PAG50586_3]|nr:MAG: flavin reductase [Sphingobacteriales bacterium JAD_PAG50586_3]
MKYISSADIENLDKVYRINLINSITGYKPANLIGTVAANNQTNLAIISSVVHLGSNPAYIGFFSRPGSVPRHTIENIRETGYFTINHIHSSFIEQAHQTSANYPRTVSEFAQCGLTEEYLHNFKAPFVGQSQIKIGLSFVEESLIKTNGVVLVVGKVEFIILPDNVLQPNGSLDLSLADDVCIAGLDTYNKVSPITKLPYARP